MTTPSAYAMEQAMATLMSARERLLADDPELAHDEATMSALLQGGGLDVLDAVLRASIHARDMAEAADVRAKATAARRDRYKARSDALRAAAFTAMDALGMTRRELPDMTVTLSAGRPALLIVDEDRIPDDYVRTTRTPVKDAILAALKAGQDVPGATLTNSLPTMTVRTR